MDANGLPILRQDHSRIVVQAMHVYQLVHQRDLIVPGAYNRTC